MKVLFLGYNESETRIIAELRGRGCDVTHTKDVITVDQIQKFDLAISYGYRRIVKPEVIRAGVQIVNCHIGYLPYNRGAHPSFWAAYDGTPQGVTIHLMDEGIDTGPILWREHVRDGYGYERREGFSCSITYRPYTFYSQYRLLRSEMNRFICRKLGFILKKKFPKTAYQPLKKGTYHSMQDMGGIAAKYYKSSEPIVATIERLKREEAEKEK